MTLLHRGRNTHQQALDVTGFGGVSDNGSRGSTLCTASVIAHQSKNRRSLHKRSGSTFNIRGLLYHS